MHGGLDERTLLSNIPPSGVLTIDLGAVRANYSKLKEMTGAAVAAVVKADAYGLGAYEVGRALQSEGCNHFFVAHLQEGFSLQKVLSPESSIYILNGVQPGGELGCAQAGLIPVLNSLEQTRRWCEAADLLKRPLPGILQFDTGMSRLGIPADEREAVAALLETTQNVPILFAMSHLASADEATNKQNAAQLAQMRRIMSDFHWTDMCFANSGGIFLGAHFHGGMVRSGIAVYGGAPTDFIENPMRPVVRLEVAVIQTREVPAGTKIGYGGTHVAQSRMRLATIAAGYADGLPRSLSDRGAVYYQGHRLPIVGRVSMDSMTIDVTGLPDGTLDLGSMVEVIGPNQSIDQLAASAGTISYEILTSIGTRYSRKYC